jgi:hypothetical protein
MVPDLKSNPQVPAAEANGHSPRPDFLDRARRILGGDIRPEDYLPVTEEVRRSVVRSMDYYRERGKGQELAPEVEPRQLLEELLSFHHGGQNIVFTQAPDGIVVLAVGLDQMKAVLSTFGRTDAGRLIVDLPLPWK